MAGEVVAYIGTLPCTQGHGIGGPFVLLPWEKRFIRGMLSRPTSALSCGRGNGKSSLISSIACAAVDGPLAQPRAEVSVIASSFDQGRIIFEAALAMLAEKVEADPGAWRIQDSANRATLEYRPTGSRLRCLGSDPRRAQGLQSALLIGDEAAEWPHLQTEKMRSAIETAKGKIPGARVAYLGTRSENPDHWYETLLQGGTTASTYVQMHAAGADDPPGHRRTWRKANPSIDAMPHLEQAIRDEYRAAMRSESMMRAFKSKRLNMGTGETSRESLIDAETWRDAEVDIEPAAVGGYILGVDVSGGAALSAAAAYWPATGRVRALACFPRQPSLEARAKFDGAGEVYEAMHADGDLILAGEHVPDLEALLREVLDRWGKPRRIIADGYHLKHVQEALQAVSFPMASLEQTFMGWKYATPLINRMQRMVASGRVHPPRRLIFRHALSEATVAVDSAGNRKLAKNTQGGRRQRFRDDVAAALLLAIGSAPESVEAPRRRRHAVA